MWILDFAKLMAYVLIGFFYALSINADNEIALIVFAFWPIFMIARLFRRK